jgi:hypothetical protein
MSIYVSQIYPEAGVSYPFNHRFQKYLSDLVSAKVGTSKKFADLYGPEYDLIFRMSAKEGLAKPEIKGPTVFKRDKDVEYTVFLPFDRSVEMDAKTLSRALDFLLTSMIEILKELEMTTTGLSTELSAIVDRILGDAKMIDAS